MRFVIFFNISLRSLFALAEDLDFADGCEVVESDFCWVAGFVYCFCGFDVVLVVGGCAEGCLLEVRLYHAHAIS